MSTMKTKNKIEIKTWGPCNHKEEESVSGLEVAHGVRVVGWQVSLGGGGKAGPCSTV